MAEQWEHCRACGEALDESHTDSACLAYEHLQARLERAEAVLRKHIARCRNVECGRCADVRAYFAEQERTDG